MYIPLLPACLKTDPFLHTSFLQYHRFSTIANITSALADGIFLMRMLLFFLTVLAALHVYDRGML